MRPAAAQPNFDIRRIEFGYRVRSGSEAISGGFQGFGNIGGFPQKWGVISVRYNSRPRWADDVQLKYFVLLRDKNGKNQMLTGAVTYVSVAAGLDHVGLVFIHPNTLARYGTVRRILVQIWSQGVLADAKEWPGASKTRWWDKLPGVPGTLRPRFFTPFEHDYEIHEEDIKFVSQ